MTKQELQKELLEKVKPGTKPSQLKKLKRSKSAGDIPQALPLPISLTRSKSQEPFNDPKYPYTTLIAQQEQNALIQEELEKLRKESETKSTTITLLRKKIEELEKTLNQASPDLEANTELDQSLLARHRNLKDWFTQYQKSKSLDKELAQNLNEASNELITQDQKIAQLQKENSQLKNQKQSLTKDLNLAQRVVELRREPLSSPWPTFPSWGLAYLVLALAFWFLMKSKNV